jgi:hypothetical protein
MQRCACPSCLASFKVPPDIVGKEVTCPRCSCRLVARSIGGKTTLALAGVDGAAATRNLPAANLPPPATADPFAFAPASRPARQSGGWGIVIAFGGVAVFIALVAAAVIAYRLSQSPGEAKQALRDLLPAEDRTPVAKMTADACIKEWGENSALFRSNYEEKFVEVRLTVGRIGPCPRYDTREYEDCVEAAGSESRELHCFLEDKSLLPKIRGGQAIVLVGKVNCGSTYAPILIHCRLVKPAPDKPAHRGR